MPTLTREELYDLVWSTPMTKVADGLGISDRGLAKICARHRVVERVISILHQLASRCDERGIAFSPVEDRMRAAIGDDDVTLEIGEKTTQVPHVLTEKEIAEQEKARKRYERLSRAKMNGTLP
jgi:chromosome segregation and condensation protein ScpB